MRSEHTANEPGDLLDYVLEVVFWEVEVRDDFVEIGGAGEFDADGLRNGSSSIVSMKVVNRLQLIPPKLGA